jgi:hypothetical protein
VDPLVSGLILLDPNVLRLLAAVVVVEEQRERMS